jgi:hypothetical protein
MNGILSPEKIVAELIAEDPTLAPHAADLHQAVLHLRALKPQITLSETTRADIRHRLLSAVIRPATRPEEAVRTFGWYFSRLLPIGALAAFLVIVLQPTAPSVTFVQESGSRPGSTVSVSDTAPSAMSPRLDGATVGTTASKGGEVSTLMTTPPQAAVPPSESTLAVTTRRPEDQTLTIPFVSLTVPATIIVHTAPYPDGGTLIATSPLLPLGRSENVRILLPEGFQGVSVFVSLVTNPTPFGSDFANLTFLGDTLGNPLSLVAPVSE